MKFFALVFVVLLASFGPGAPAPAVARGVVHVELQSPQSDTTVNPGGRIDWVLTAHVSSDDNLGLAMISVDVEQALANPERIDIPRATGRSPLMEAFDRPRGFTNPGPDKDTSGYCGTQVGRAGERDLRQIGGAQNTFGVTGPCLGPNGEICLGQDVVVTQGVGQSGGQVVATGSFFAPQTVGSYEFQVASAVATTLQEVASPPNPARVARANVQLAIPGFRFEVQ